MKNSKTPQPKNSAEFFRRIDAQPKSVIQSPCLGRIEFCVREDAGNAAERMTDSKVKYGEGGVLFDSLHDAHVAHRSVFQGRKGLLVGIAVVVGERSIEVVEFNNDGTFLDPAL